MPFIPTISMVNSAGVAQSVVDQLETIAGAALDAWGAMLAGDAAINLRISIQPNTGAGRAEGGNGAGIPIGIVDGHNVYEPITAYELRTGEERSESGADIYINVAQDYLLNELFLDPTLATANDIPGNRTDAFSVLVHEIGHGLGFTGYWYEPSNSFSYNANTTYDTRLVLRGGEAFFDGPNVRRVMGDAIPLTDNNYTHYGNSSAFPGTADDPLTGLMNGVTYYRGWRYSISSLDLAVLADMGLGTIGDDVFDIAYMHAFTGGLGDDRYHVHAAADVIREFAGEGIDTVVAGIDYALGANLENLILDGVGNIAGTGNDLANVITGNAGSNLFAGGAGSDTASYVAATAGVTVRLTLTRPQDTLGAGIDTLVAMENLGGSSFDDRLTGGATRNLLDGGEGNDVLNGLAGNDAMRGGRGDDLYYVDAANDVAIEGANAGWDTVRSTIDYVLPNNVEELFLGGAARDGTGNALANILHGSNAGNTLFGLSGDDIVRGGGGRDILLGGDGADLIDGGIGKDTLTGGAGRDAFQFRDGDFGITRSLADVITDFSRADAERIQLQLVDANTALSGNQAFAWIGNGAFTGAAGQLRHVRGGGMTYVEGDTNGDGLADFAIALTGMHNLLASDFVL